LPDQRKAGEKSNTSSQSAEKKSADAEKSGNGDGEKPSAKKKSGKGKKKSYQTSIEDLYGYMVRDREFSPSTFPDFSASVLFFSAL
jgi:hypothetical protein